jgi:hypothetical protein
MSTQLSYPVSPYTLMNLTKNIYVSDDVLQETARFLVGSGLRGNTHRTYNSAQRKYLNFCIEFSYTALPATNQVILKYVAFLYQLGLKDTSISLLISNS